MRLRLLPVTGAWASKFRSAHGQAQELQDGLAETSLNFDRHQFFDDLRLELYVFIAIVRSPDSERWPSSAQLLNVFNSTQP
jgi:hypothetical protein